MLEMRVFAFAIAPVDVSKLGSGSHDLAGLERIVGLGVYLGDELHLPRWRFSLYLEVWMLRLIHWSRLMVGEVMMRREKILEFSCSIYFSRMLRFSDE
jgi:hypothetical protein